MSEGPLNLGRLNVSQLRGAASVVSFWIKRCIKRYPQYVALLFAMAIASLLSQSAFLLLLTDLLGRFRDAPVATGSNGGLTQLLKSALSGLPTEYVIGLLTASQVAFALVQLFTQLLVSRLSIWTYRDTMDELADRAISQARRGTFSAQNMPTAAMFTKDARYGSMMVYRSTRMTQPLMLVPFAFLVCIWTSSALSLIVVTVALLTLPIHAMLARHGMKTIKILGSSAAEHSRTKKAFVAGLNSMPKPMVDGLEKLKAEFVVAPSETYFDAFLKRKMLAATSQFISSCALTIAALFALLLFFWPQSKFALNIEQIVVFVAALRLLAQALSQIATNATILASVVPLAERAYKLLTPDRSAADDEVLPVRLPKLSEIEGAGEAEVFVLSAVSVSPAVVRTLFPDQPQAVQGAAVRIRYWPLLRSIKGDLLLPGTDWRQSLEPYAPKAILDEIDAVLHEENTKGWSQQLWEKVSAKAQIYCTVRALLSDGAVTVLPMIGHVRNLLGAVEWNGLRNKLSAQSVGVVSLFEEIPKGFSLGKAQIVYLFDGRTLRRYEGEGTSADQLAKLKEEFDLIKKRLEAKMQTMEGDPDNDEF